MYFPGHTNIHGPYDLDFSDLSPLDPGRNTIEAIEGTFPSSYSNIYRSGKYEYDNWFNF